MINAPCYKCADRLPGGVCHADCERYKEYKQNVEDFNKIRQEKVEISAALEASAIRRCKSRKARRGDVR